MTVRRGAAQSAGAWGLPGDDPEERVLVTLDPGGGDLEPLTIRAGERLLTDPAAGEGRNGGTAEMEVPLPAWHGQHLGGAEIAGARLEIADAGFGGLGGRATADIRGDGAVALTLGSHFESCWIPAAEGPAEVEEPAGVDQPPPRRPPWPHAAWSPRTAMVARARPGADGRVATGAGHGREVRDPAAPVLRYRFGFAQPFQGRVDVCCTPTVWERLAPLRLSLGADDAGRTLRIRSTQGRFLRVAVLGCTGEGSLAWAVRWEGPLPLRAGMLHRHPEADVPVWGEWSSVPGLPDTDGWHRAESPLLGPSRRAQVACVAVGCPASPLTFLVPSGPASGTR